MLNWTDREDGIDDVLAEDVNSLAHAIILLEKSLITSKNIILSNAMTKDEIVSAINNAEPGTVFDIQTNLELYDVNIAFPEESFIYSSKGGASIFFGYSDESIEGEKWENSYNVTFGNRCRIYDITLTSTYATDFVVGNFGDGCTSTNCKYDSYAWGSMGTNCIFLHCDMYMFQLTNLGSNNTYIGCDWRNTDYVQLDVGDACLLDCQAETFYVGADNSKELIEKIKALNPDMNIVDAEGNEFKGLYATKEDIGNIETALDNIIEIQNALIGGDA